MKIEEMISRLSMGDPIALAKALTVVENKRKDYRTLLERLHPLRRNALKIGMTGAPGAGKSTLVERLIAHLKGRGLNIGVLAVDPSSPLSGGALLGDRIRMIQHSNDRNVFIRSVASRGSLGGLSGAVYSLVDVMEAAGKDVIIIETVGVGQSEIDIVNVADMVVMVLTPTAGDEIQIFKAGVIEVADIFVINKADLGGADSKVREINAYFAMSQKTPVIVETSAREDFGMTELIDALFAFQDGHAEEIRRKKEALRKNLILRILEERFKETVLADEHLLPADLEHANPFAVAREVFAKIVPGGTHDKKN